MEFQGANDGSQSNQAYADDNASAPPVFLAGFANFADTGNLGIPCLYGNSAWKGSGLVVLTTDGARGLYGFQFNDGLPMGFGIFAAAQNITMGAWHHLVLQINKDGTRGFHVDGVKAPDSIGGTLPPPSAPVVLPAIAGPTRVAFGSDYNAKYAPPANPGADCHALTGGLAEWCEVTGAPTGVEIARHRGGESPVSIWGARVKGWWRFDRVLNGLVPNEIVRGMGLTLVDVGMAAGHALPRIMSS
jgi:hypothetical protein